MTFPPKRLEALLALGALEVLPRTGWLLAGAARGESVAGHTLGVGHLILSLGPDVDPPLDWGRCLGMALLHDAPEAASGDLPSPAAQHLPQGAKQMMEEALAKELVSPLGALPEALFEEYATRESREALFVHLCDKLQMGVQLLRLERLGGGRLAPFREGLERLDCSAFAPCEALQKTLLEALEAEGAEAP